MGGGQAAVHDRAEFDRLRAENARLRRRLEAAQSVARERQARIEDLLGALRMLPEAWTRRLRQVARDHAAAAVRPDVLEVARGEREPRGSVVEVAATPAPPAKVELAPGAVPREPAFQAEPLDLDALAGAERAWAEVNRLRSRLEREHLGRLLARS